MEAFTQRVEVALNDAQHSAQMLHHAELKPLHVLAAFFDMNESLAVDFANQHSVLPQVRGRLKTAIVDLPRLGHSASEIRMSSDLVGVLAAARKYSERAGDRYVPEEWVLLALVVVLLKPWLVVLL